MTASSWWMQIRDVFSYWLCRSLVVSFGSESPQLVFLSSRTLLGACSCPGKLVGLSSLCDSLQCNIWFLICTPPAKHPIHVQVAGIWDPTEKENHQASVAAAAIYNDTRCHFLITMATGRCWLPSKLLWLWRPDPPWLVHLFY